MRAGLILINRILIQGIYTITVEQLSTLNRLRALAIDFNAYDLLLFTVSSFENQI